MHEKGAATITNTLFGALLSDRLLQPDNDAVKPATDWLFDKQVFTRGDWTGKAPARAVIPTQAGIHMTTIAQAGMVERRRKKEVREWLCPITEACQKGRSSL